MSQGKILNPLRVVTVDDSQIIAERVQAMLSDLDNVEFLGNASNISKALNLIKEQAPNVVILDIHLEDDLLKATGITLLIILRKKYPELKILILTNLAEEQYRQSCIDFGADYFFDKSDDFDKIPETLKKIQSNGIAEISDRNF